jgi:hypothetical protein
MSRSRLADGERGGYTWRHSVQMPNASSAQARKETASIIVGVTILLEYRVSRLLDLNGVCMLYALFTSEATPGNRVKTILIGCLEISLAIAGKVCHLVVLVELGA